MTDRAWTEDELPSEATEHPRPARRPAVPSPSNWKPRGCPARQLGQGRGGAAGRMEPPAEGGGEMAAALGAAKRALRAELRHRLRALGAAEKQRQSRLLSRKVGASRKSGTRRRGEGCGHCRTPPRSWGAARNELFPSFSRRPGL